MVFVRHSSSNHESVVDDRLHGSYRLYRAVQPGMGSDFRKTRSEKGESHSGFQKEIGCEKEFTTGFLKKECHKKEIAKIMNPLSNSSVCPDHPLGNGVELCQKRVYNTRT